jgi:hypothetical protein
MTNRMLEPTVLLKKAAMAKSADEISGKRRKFKKIEPSENLPRS